MDKVIKFDDFEDLEYRKGSKEFGGLLTRLLEYLRLVRTNSDKEVIMNVNEFENNSNITKDELLSLNKTKEEGKSLFDFDITFSDDQVIFNGFDSGKTRPFESLNPIRDEYVVMGVDDFYKKKASEYANPHIDDIKQSIEAVNDKNIVDFNNVLDLACGSGEVTNILDGLGYGNIEGVDLYMCDEYNKKTSYVCSKLSFSDVQQGKLSDKKYKTVVCSYALHLADKSILHDLLWELSLISEYLVIISPTKKPEISEDIWELVDNFNIGKAKTKVFKSKFHK